jgi:hypothetical protein
MHSFVVYDRQTGFKILNPLDDGENFAEKWNRTNGEGDKYREAFYAWHISVKEDFRLGLQELDASTYKDRFHSSFGIGETFVDRVEGDLPRNWILPGRPNNVTRNTELAALAVGFVSSGKDEEQDITPPGRLG